MKEVVDKELNKASDSAHDINHIMRVYDTALKIAKHENKVDLDVLKAAVLLHDIGEYKEMSDSSGETDHAIESAKMAEPILRKLGFTEEKVKHIQDCIISHRYKTKNKPKSIESKILFDADKLDSVGAIGIARSFCLVGKNGASIYKKTDTVEYVRENMNGKIDGRINDKRKHSPQMEFAVKFKFLTDKLFTQKAKEICRERVSFLENFLNRLEREINGEL